MFKGFLRVQHRCESAHSIPVSSGLRLVSGFSMSYFSTTGLVGLLVRFDPHISSFAYIVFQAVEQNMILRHLPPVTACYGCGVTLSGWAPNQHNMNNGICGCRAEQSWAVP